jgi:signal transduction histidine kinase
MAQMGLDMLQIQDEGGRILSSGHFRNAYDTRDPLPELLVRAEGPALVDARAAGGLFPALAAADSLRLGPRRLTLVGGIAVDGAFLARLSRPPDAGVTLSRAAEPPPPGRLRRTEAHPEIRDGRSGTAHIVVIHTAEPQEQHRRSLDRWLLGAVVVTALAVILAALWLAAVLSRPLRELAARTEALDVERVFVDVDGDRRDEIGALSRALAALTRRIRAGTLQLREAERRAAVGDVARQVNHDIRNGLAPLRQVIRHLTQVAETDPHGLPAVLRERQGTLQAGIEYLESLAARYARLTPERVRAPCRVAAIVREAALDPRVAVHVEDDPVVTGDPVAVRRLVENLVRNALESVGANGESVAVTVSRAVHRGEERARIVVEDTGPGVPPEARETIFEDFYTTKPGGTGLGLSIVRRLAGDLGGTVRLEDAPRGARFVVDLPLGDGS